MTEIKEAIKKLTNKLFGYDDFEDVVGYMGIGLLTALLISALFLLVGFVIAWLGFWSPIILVVPYLLYRLGKQVDGI